MAMKVDLKYAERQLRFWQKKVAVLAGRFAQDELEPSNAVKRLMPSNAKEGEERETNLPPTPPIRKEKEEQENHTHTACARERPRVDEVAEECRRIGSDIDPAYFCDFYDAAKDGWPRDWRAKLRNWTKNPIESGRLAAPPDPTEPPESPDERQARLKRESAERQARLNKLFGLTPQTPQTALR